MGNADSNITGKMVSMLLARLIKAGYRSTRSQLEFLEFDCRVTVSRLEDLTVSQFTRVVAVLNAERL